MNEGIENCSQVTVIIAPILRSLPCVKGLFSFGIIASTLSTVLWFQGKSYMTLLIARACQGVSANIIWTSGMAMVHGRVSIEQSGMATGIISGASACGELIGIVSGGFLFEEFGEHATFIMLMSLTVVDILLRLLLVDPGRDEARTTETSKLINADCDAHSNRKVSDGDGQTERHVLAEQQRRIFRSLISNRRFLSILSVLLLSAAIRAALETVRPYPKKIEHAEESANTTQGLPLYLGECLGWPSDMIGLTMFVFLVPTLLSTFYGRLKDLVGAFKPCILALLSMSLLFTLLFSLSPETAATKIVFHGALLLIGLFMFMVGVILTSCLPDIMHSASCDDQSSLGVMYAAMRFSIAAGIFLGPFLADSADSAWGWRLTCCRLIGASLIGFVATVAGWLSLPLLGNDNNSIGSMGHMDFIA